MKQSVEPPRNSAWLPLASTWLLVASISLPRFDCLVRIYLTVVVVVFGVLVLVLVDPVLRGPLDQCEEVVEAFQIPVRGELKRDRWFDDDDVVVAEHSRYGFVSRIWVLMRKRREPNHPDH